MCITIKKIISDFGCTTPSYRKTSLNNTCGCGVFRSIPGLFYQSAVRQCQRIGGRLPEIMNAQENAAIFNLMVRVCLLLHLINNQSQLRQRVQSAKIKSS